MPKIKPTTLFSKRTLPILLLDDSDNELVKASMLVQPIVDELVKRVSKTVPDVIHVENTGNAVFNCMKTIDAILSVTKPTIVVAPGTSAAANSPAWDGFDKDRKQTACGAIAATAASLDAYARLLVAAGGGFIVHVTSAGNSQDMNEACPVIQFDPNRNSYIDIEHKVQIVLDRICSAASINHYMTVQSVANNHRANKLAVCLGSWGRGLWDVPEDETEAKRLKTVVNVRGLPGSPVTAEEFIDKVWCNPSVPKDSLNPSNALIVRNPSIESKLVLAKLISDKKTASGIQFVEV